jgi:hypothetical protein
VGHPVLRPLLATPQAELHDTSTPNGSWRSRATVKHGFSPRRWAPNDPPMCRSGFGAGRTFRRCALCATCGLVHRNIVRRRVTQTPRISNKARKVLWSQRLAPASCASDPSCDEVDREAPNRGGAARTNRAGRLRTVFVVFVALAAGMLRAFLRKDVAGRVSGEGSCGLG